ncbi:flagellar biosynthesis anti-sigma factor FlgM [Sulfurimonas aquatica]|uniref:Flagellar biosynthesis anti-sigma factor FlgM n=1 Tax=Sulfurimonas aquatica TaxID=2672570 RepID=A0A975B1A1_9BACT|nr:flagellar biosynthesis anti-sigma factor FlgM [Sulfurimonas aquatica]QSZ42391.1 flagellar biosynthesis anti-sigma factor FlgM [Sulfurimonas aquatica]
MISQTNSSVLQGAYASKTNETKEQKQGVNITKQGDMSKVEQLRESINSGEYKVNIEALSKKIAESLL